MGPCFLLACCPSHQALLGMWATFGVTRVLRCLSGSLPLHCYILEALCVFGVKLTES